jgi:DNA polymerase I
VVSDVDTATNLPWEMADVWDFETTGVYWFRDEPYALAVLINEQPYVCVGDALDVAISELARAAETPGRTIIAYNAKFELHFASKRVSALDVRARIVDPSLALFLLDENRFSGAGHGLKDAVKQLFDYKMVDFVSMLGTVTEVTGEYKTRNCKDCAGKGWRGRGHETCEPCQGVGKVARPVTRRRQRRIDEVPVEEMAQYAGEDVWWTKRVWEWAEARLSQHGLLEENFNAVQTPLLVALYRAEHTGVRIDRDAVVAMREKYVRRIAAIDEEIKVRTGVEVEGSYALDDEADEDRGDSGDDDAPSESTLQVNLDSPAQVDWFLYTFLGEKRPKFRSRRKAKDGSRVASKWQTDENCLLWLAKNSKQEIPKLLLERRKAVRYVGTYLNNMLEFSYEESPGVWVMYPNFNMTAAKTGRLSSSRPMNFQNIPHREDFRALFIARPGKKFVIADAKQIELRFLAHFSREPALVDAFSDPKRDLHAETRDMLELEGDDGRYIAKTFNFAEVYEVYGATAAMQLFRDTEGGIDWTKEMAQEKLDQLRANRPMVKAWKARVINFLSVNKFVKTIEKRYRRLPGISSSQWAQKKYAERQGINSIIQGSVGDMFARLLGDRTFFNVLRLQVHDEVVCEVDADEAHDFGDWVRDAIESFTQRYDMRVPILASVGIGDDWSAKA